MPKPKLNPRQELFCKLYTTDREMFGNGTQAYIEAYDIDLKQKGAYDGAKSNAYKLLTNTYIIERINELLESGGLTEEHMDKRLLFWANQGASPQTSIAAIKEFNALKKRTKENEINVNITPIYGGKSEV